MNGRRRALAAAVVQALFGDLASLAGPCRQLGPPADVDQLLRMVRDGRGLPAVELRMQLRRGEARLAPFGFRLPASILLRRNRLSREIPEGGDRASDNAVGSLLPARPDGQGACRTDRCSSPREVATSARFWHLLRSMIWCRPLRILRPDPSSPRRPGVGSSPFRHCAANDNNQSAASCCRCRSDPRN